MVSKREALEKIEFLQEFATNFYEKIEVKLRCPTRAHCYATVDRCLANLYKLYKKIVRDTHFFHAELVLVILEPRGT